MERSVSKNPAVWFIQWSSDSKSFSVYNKDTKTKDDVPLPFSFLVLDNLATVTGWNDNLKSALFSNEVHSTGQEELQVKTFKGGYTKKGFWADIKEEVTAMGGRFTASVYVMPLVGISKGEIINIKLKGGALKAWIGKENGSSAYQVKSVEEGKKGKVTFTMPVFEKYEVTRADMVMAKELDKKLQDYLMAYKKTAFENKASLGSIPENKASLGNTPENKGKDNDGAELPF